jgi:hypothetical protein
MAPPFRAEQIDSLMRSAELLAARAIAGMATSYSQSNAKMQLATENAIAGTVAKQPELGTRPITSGESAKDKLFSGFFERLGECKS